MKLVCSWCGALIEEGEATMIQGTSHGICKDCLAVTMAEMDAEDAAKQQAARDDAAPADTPTGARVDR